MVFVVSRIASSRKGLSKGRCGYTLTPGGCPTTCCRRPCVHSQFATQCSGRQWRGCSPHGPGLYQPAAVQERQAVQTGHHPVAHHCRRSHLCDGETVSEDGKSVPRTGFRAAQWRHDSVLRLEPDDGACSQGKEGEEGQILMPAVELSLAIVYSSQLAVATACRLP